MKARIALLLACAAFVGHAVPLVAAEPAVSDMAARFGAREDVLQASLSPDGNQIAIVAPEGAQGARISILNLAASGALVPVKIGSVDGNPERISSCKWASNSRLLCTMWGVIKVGEIGLAPISRIVAMDSNGGNVKILEDRHSSQEALDYSLFGGSVIDWSSGEDGHVLMMRRYIPERSTGWLTAQTLDGMCVDDVDTVSLRTKNIEKPRFDAREFITDGRGTVRIMGTRPANSSGFDKDQQRYFYRLKTGGNWKPLSIVLQDDAAFDPHAVDPVKDVSYGLKRTDGRLAAYSKALDGSGTETLLFAHPDVDVDGFVGVGREGRIIGVSYATDRREVSYFDPVMERLAKSLSKALPHLPLVYVVDASQDENRLLVWAGSDTDAGRYYVLDRKTSHMELLMPDRPQLEGLALGEMRAVRYPAADGTMIPAYLTLPPGGAKTGLPAIILPHGGPSARDEWGFDWLTQFFVSQGYAVLQPNFRGSAGYGDQWFQKNGFQNWRTAIGDVDDGARWLVKQGIARADKLAVVGWSYGGYAALQSAVTEPGLFKAVIAIAPVTDLDRLREERLRWSDYASRSAFIGTGPHIADGSPARHADAVKVPVLLFHGDMDRNVGVSQSRLMDERLHNAGKSSELIVYDGLDHYLDSSTARTDMLTRSAAFLAKVLGR